MPISSSRNNNIPSIEIVDDWPLDSTHSGLKPKALQRPLFTKMTLQLYLQGFKCKVLSSTTTITLNFLEMVDQQ